MTAVSSGTTVEVYDIVVDMASSAALDNFDDPLLVERARHRDAPAFTELVRRYSTRIFHLARHITQHQEDAEDVLQETFLKAYSHLDGFEGHSKFSTWLVRIAVNESLMKLRKRKADRTVSLDEPIEGSEEPVVREIAVWDSPEQRFSGEEMRSILEGAVDGLAPIYRTVFVLRDIEELSAEETASVLDLTVAAVKTRLLRARLQLREKLTRVFKRKGEDVFAYL